MRAGLFGLKGVVVGGVAPNDAGQQAGLQVGQQAYGLLGFEQGVGQGLLFALLVADEQ